MAQNASCETEASDFMEQTFVCIENPFFELRRFGLETFEIIQVYVEPFSWQYSHEITDGINIGDLTFRVFHCLIQVH